MPQTRDSSSHDAYKLNFILNDASTGPVIKPHNSSDTVDPGSSKSEFGDLADQARVSLPTVNILESQHTASFNTSKSPERLNSPPPHTPSTTGPPLYAPAPNVSDPHGREITAQITHGKHPPRPQHPRLPSSLGTEYKPWNPLLPPVASFDNALNQTTQGTSQTGPIYISHRDRPAIPKLKGEPPHKLSHSENLIQPLHRVISRSSFGPHAPLIIPERPEHNQAPGNNFGAWLSPDQQGPASSSLKVQVSQNQASGAPLAHPQYQQQSLHPPQQQQRQQHQQHQQQPQLPLLSLPTKTYAHDSYGPIHGLDPFHTPPTRNPPPLQATPTYSSPRPRPQHTQVYSPRPGGTSHSGTFPRPVGQSFLPQADIFRDTAPTHPSGATAYHAPYGYMYPPLQAPSSGIGPPISYQSPATPSQSHGPQAFGPPNPGLVHVMPAASAPQPHGQALQYTHHESPHGVQYSKLRAGESMPLWTPSVVDQTPPTSGERPPYYARQQAYSPYAGPPLFPNYDSPMRRSPLRGSPVRGASIRGSPVRGPSVWAWGSQANPSRSSRITRRVLTPPSRIVLEKQPELPDESESPNRSDWRQRRRRRR